VSIKNKLARGVVFAFAYQLFSVGISFLSLIVTTRLIPPDEFGVVTLVLLPLAGLNNLAASFLITHAVYVPGNKTPDWDLYGMLGLAGHGILAIVCNAIALMCWNHPVYQPMAPLLHVASVGIVMEAFVRLDIVMSQRELAVGRNQVLLALCDCVTLGTTVVCALLGMGALGLVLGNSVFRSIPFVIHLFMIRKWRINWSTWRGFGWSDVRGPMLFALQYTLANSGNTLRQFAEAALLPLALTKPEVGLLSRAQSLFGQTVSRVVQGVSEVAMPALPATADHHERFTRAVVLYHRVMGGLLIAGTFCIATVGPTLSAVLYGPKWKDADPLLAPTAAIAALLYYCSMCSTTLLSARAGRANTLILVAVALSSVPGLVALACRVPILQYLAWQLFGAGLASLISLSVCHQVVSINRIVPTLVPSVVASAVAGVGVLIIEHFLVSQTKYVRLVVDLLVFVSLHVITMRLLFPHWLAESLDTLPMGVRIKPWLRLKTPTIAETPT
jgi:O-antigen/teichoic acid export membrane protein